MADVLFVCVRDDIARAEALSEVFEAVGFSIEGELSDAAMCASGACVVIWSPAATASTAFLRRAQRAMMAGNAVVASFSAEAAPPSTDATPVFDLAGWTVDPEDSALDPLFRAVDRRVAAAREAHALTALVEETVKSLPDAEVTTPPIADARLSARTAWLAEIPTAYRAKQRFTPKTPDLALRRAGAIARALAIVALVAVGVVGVGAALRGEGGTSRATVAITPATSTTLASAPFDQLAVGGPVDDSVEPPDAEEPVGRRGFEPPSASSLGRIDRAPRAQRLRRAANVEASFTPTAANLAAPVNEVASAPQGLVSTPAPDHRPKPREKPEDAA